MRYKPWLGKQAVKDVDCQMVRRGSLGDTSTRKMEWAPQKIEKKGVKVAKNIFLIYFNYWFILLNIYDCNKLEQKIATKELEKKIKKTFHPWLTSFLSMSFFLFFYIPL